ERGEAPRAVAEARVKRADAERRRAGELFTRKAISKEEFDKVAADHAEAETALLVAKAAGEVARLNLAFTRVVAPTSGRIERRLDPGNLVKADETLLATLVSVDPVHVVFERDEIEALALPA